jgi:TonB family protein
MSHVYFFGEPSNGRQKLELNLKTRLPIDCRRGKKPAVLVAYPRAFKAQYIAPAALLRGDAKTMNRKMLARALTAIGLSICLYGLGCMDESETVVGSTQGKQDPTVELPKVRNPVAAADIDNRSFTVSVPAQGEFYLAGQRVTREALAVAIRDALADKRVDEQRVYLRCSAALSFGAVREVLNVVRQVGYVDVDFVVRHTDSPRDAVLKAALFVAFDFKGDPADLITVPPRRQTTTTKRPPPPPPPPPPPRSVRGTKVQPIEPLGSQALVVETKNRSAPPDQAVALNRQVMSLSKLRSLLRDLLPQRPEKHVFIKPSRDTSYSDVITAMDVIKHAGAEPTYLLIDEVAVPSGIPRPDSHPPAINLPGRVAGGVPGGVPGGVRDEGPDDSPKIIRKSGGTLKESAIRRVEPTTPPSARKARVTGVVIVEVTVNEEGDVIAARAISGPALLRDAAVNAARGWKFTPTLLSGRPVKVIGTLAFTFK